MRKFFNTSTSAWMVMVITSAQFLSGTASAQLSIGLAAGSTNTHVITSTSSFPFTHAEAATGYSITVPVEYKMADWFSVMADPGVMKKNYKMVRTDFFQGVYENYNNTYLQLPLMAHFMFGGQKLKGFLNMGGYAGYWAGGHVSGTEPNILNPVDDAFTVANPSSVYGENKSYSFSEKYSFNSTRDKRIEAGWVLGVGVSYQLDQHYKIFIEGRQTQALTDQQKKYMTNQIPRYNQTFGFTLGCLIRLQMPAIISESTEEQ